MRQGNGQRQGLRFSVLFFASDSEVVSNHKYDFLREVSAAADVLGFDAVWLPERHFHRFGGLFPNPSLAAAAAACWTRRLSIRGGSVVAPLHNPVRIAEEWAMVDNLSGGRVEISFGSGWHANDFVLAPSKYQSRQSSMAEHIEMVTKLWRGEEVTLQNGTGQPVSVSVRPRPLQRELRIWLTASGSTATFASAGTLGAGILTHLLHQDVRELAEKIAVYKAARQQAGLRPDEGRIAVMLHTFLHEDRDAAKRIARKPLIDYLTASAQLDVAASEAGGRLGGNLPLKWNEQANANIKEVARLAAQRYLDGALIGSPESCRGLLASLAEVGVTEVACLVDFGVDIDDTLSSLDLLSSCFLNACSPGPVRPRQHG